MNNLLTLIIFATIAFLFAFRYPSASKVNWKEWNEAYEEAQKSNKVILVDAYTDWCGWCKKMDRDTYSKADIIKMVNKNFLPVKFNPEIQNASYRVGEKELSGPELLGALSGGQRVGYPTTFFLSVKKNAVNKVSGYKGPADFLEILQEQEKWGNE